MPRDSSALIGKMTSSEIGVPAAEIDVIIRLGEEENRLQHFARVQRCPRRRGGPARRPAESCSKRESIGARFRHDPFDDVAVDGRFRRAFGVKRARS